MIALFKALLVITFGAVLGLFATDYAVRQGTRFGTRQLGPWTAFLRAGAPDADPYTRAVQARDGARPLALAEGLMFVAHGETAEGTFNPHCAYAVRGPVPPARFWTLTLSDPMGSPIANAAERYGFVSSELLRDADGNFDIAVSADVRPGIWLPIGAMTPFVLVLRLYDTSLSASAVGLDAAALPAIVKGACS